MSESDIKVSVVGDSSNIDQTFAKVERGADKMAQAVGKSGAQAGKGMDGVGKGADGAAKGVERSTKSMIASIQRQTAVLEAGSRTNAKYWETLASQRGVDGGALKPYLDQLEAVRAKQGATTAALASGGIQLDKYGLSAKQTAAAMRGVPAQMTDIIVSLQGGQRPLTVLLQQGGQLKDLFGGIVPAARALGAGVMAMVNPFTLAAAAIGGMYMAYSAGAAESEAFNKTLIMTGNAAGVSGDQLMTMAARIDGVTGTQRNAAAALNEFAKSGKVASTNLQDFATAAIRWEEATGTAIADTVKHFEELGKDPLKASLKLNESMNYLTASVYEQIDALVDQGRETDAAAVAQKAFADSLDDRAPKMLENLGLIERGWLAIKKAISETIDEAVSFGRSQTLQERLSSEIQKLREMERLRNIGSIDLFGTYAAQKQAVDNLQEQINLQQKLIGYEGDRARELKATQNIGDYLGDSSRLSRSAQMERDVAKEKTLYAARVADAKGNTDTLQKLETAHQVAMANIKEKYKEKKGPKSEEQKELERQQKAELKAIADFEKERQKSIEGQYSEIAAIGEKASKIEDEIAVYGMSRQAIQAMEIARLREQATVLSGFSGTEEQIELIKREIAERERLGEAIAGKERLDAEKKANEETRREWEKTVDQYGDVFRRGFADMLNNGRDGWKSFTKSLVTTFKTSVADQIYKMFAQPFVVNIVGNLMGLMGGSTAASVAEAAGGSTSGASGLGGLMNVFSVAKNLYSLFTGGVTSTIASSMSTMGSIMGSSAMQTFALGMTGKGATLAAGLAGPTTAGSTAAGAGSAFAGAIPVIGWIAAGMMANQALYKKGWDATNGSLNPGVDVVFGGATGAVHKALEGIGLSGSLASLISGSAITSALFGRRNKEYGATSINGQFSGAGFRGYTETPWDQKGGLFRSSKSGMQYGNLDRSYEDSLGASFLAIRSGVAQLVDSIGISADSLLGYTQSIKLTLTGDAAGDDALITNMLKGVGENMVRSVVPTIGQYIKESESAMDALARLSVSLSAANGYIQVLGNTLFDVSLAGADAASKLADAFGGLDEMGKITQAFYEVAYTEGERATAAMESMRIALQSIGVAMPRTMVELREMALALDLTTDAGRQAYAALLAVAPQFAAVTDALANAAQALGDKLMESFSVRSPLMAAMDAMQLKTLLLGDTLVSTYESMGSISTLFLDLDSGLITFGGVVSTLDGEMTGAQEASAILADQMGALQVAAKGAVIDFAKFEAQLDTIDTDGFIATIAKAFQSLAQRIDGVIGEIGAERIAVRQAAQEILDPSAMTPEMIRRQIAGINTTLPSGSGVLESGARLAVADAESEAKRKAAESAKKAYDPAQANYDGARNAISALVGQVANAQALYDQAYGGATRHYKYSEGRAAGRMWAAQLPGLGADLDASKAALASAQAASTAAKLEEVNRLQEVYNAALAESTAATAAAAAAALDAKQTQVAFADALQDFAIDAGKSVVKLSNLREETLKYYQAQKQLAELMGASAFGLRKTVADYRYSQMDPDEQFNRMQGEYAKNYAMALSTDGEMLAGYADKMNAALTPMLEAARNSFGSQAQYDGFVATALARAEAIAGRLDTLAPDTYDAESLALLGQIDATLAALEESSRSAEQLIVAAVNASRDATVDGLRQIANALTGGEVAAFAAGGFHSGGLRIVGENGPELEATGPSRIFTASQTSAMLSGGGSNEMAVELRALRQEVANLRIEARATATTSAKTARSLEKLERGGIGVYAQDDEALPIIAETV